MPIWDAIKIPFRGGTTVLTAHPLVITSDLTLSLLKAIKVNILPSNSTHRYEVQRRTWHLILCSDNCCCSYQFSQHHSYISYMSGSENLHLNLRSKRVNFLACYFLGKFIHCVFKLVGDGGRIYLNTVLCRSKFDCMKGHKTRAGPMVCVVPLLKCADFSWQ